VPLRRRDFMTLVIGLVTGVPLAARAQQGAKRLAVFDPSEATAVLRPETEQRYFKAFFDELRRLGYVENQNLIVEAYGREQNTSGPETLAAEIVQGIPDLVYAVGPGAPLFRELTATIPIVALTGEPVVQRIADSLAHPRPKGELLANAIASSSSRTAKKSATGPKNSLRKAGLSGAISVRIVGCMNAP
jgi:putative ABC transport system substrate-binding protein